MTPPGTLLPVRIDCDSCGASIPAGDLELTTMLAKCRGCDSVFEFASRMGRAAPDATQGPAGPRAEVPLPEGISLRTTEKGLAIERRWWSPAVIPMLGFTLFWDGFMVVWYAIAITQRQWMMAIFGTFHGLIGLGLLYGCLLGLVQRTRVKVEGGELVVEHYPLPYQASTSWPAGRLEQLYVKRAEVSNDSAATYELHAILSDRSHVKILDGLQESAQALFLEQRIESLLGITDRPVRGELERFDTPVLPAGGRASLPDRLAILSLPRSATPSRGSPGTRTASPEAVDAAGPAVSVSPVASQGIPRCPVCGDAILGAEKVCDLCETRHHPECWEYGDGCSTFGCRRSATRR